MPAEAPRTCCACGADLPDLEAVEVNYDRDLWACSEECAVAFEHEPGEYDRFHEYDHDEGA